MNMIKSLKKTVFLIFILFGFVGQMAWADNAGSTGDDLIPWPWGTECPFPWDDIGGTYQLSKVRGGVFSLHFLEFNVEQSQKKSLTFLEINEYNSIHTPYAKGKGYSLRDKRVVRGLMTPINEGGRYEVMVRSYVKNKKEACSKDNLMVVVTFCSLRSKSCLDNVNYELTKLSPSPEK